MEQGFTSHSTQNRSFRRCSSQPISWLGTGKNKNPTKQHKTVVQFSPNFLALLPMAVVRFCSGAVAIRHVLPVLWMTSHLHVVCHRGKGNVMCVPDVWTLHVNLLVRFLEHLAHVQCVRFGRGNNGFPISRGCPIFLVSVSISKPKST